MIKVNLNKTKSSVIYNTQATDLGSSNTAFSTVITTALKNVRGKGVWVKSALLL